MSELRSPEIETKRFLLRQITSNDLNAWIRLKYADPEMMLHMPKSDLPPEERAKRAYKFFEGAWSRNGYGAWVITDKRSGQLLGDCYLESEEESGSGYVEIGYDVGRAFWGQGIATEAAHAVLRFAFENTPVERIVGVAVKDNIGSQRVLEHMGFTLEKEARLYDLDVVVYALSREQFRPQKAFYRVSWP